MNISVTVAGTPKQIEQCLAIRLQVFVEGQQVPLAEELDGKDEESTHYLLTVDAEPVGVARVRLLNDYAKIERVGVLEHFQGKGLGKKIMQVILADLQQQPEVCWARLGAQTHAIAFYEGLGFAVCSEEYLDAGIPHKDMQLCLSV